jgi:hypothetical protein
MRKNKILTELGRIFIEDEVFLVGGLMIRVVRFQLEFVAGAATPPNVSEGASIADKDPSGPIESVFDGVSHFSKMWKPHPACLHRT